MTDSAPSAPQPQDPGSPAPAPQPSAPPPPAAAAEPAPRGVPLGYVGSRGAAPPPPPEDDGDDHGSSIVAGLRAAPLAWLVIALQIGLFIAGSAMSGWNVNTIDYAAVARLGCLDFWNDHTAPWRWVATLFLQGMGLNALISVSILWGLAPPLEKQLGKWRFALLYALGGLGGNFARLLLHKYVSGQVAINLGCSGSSAAFALLGSLVGVYLGFGAVKQAFMALVQRAGYYVVLIGIAVLLNPQIQRRFGAGIDIWGTIADMTIGAVAGLAVTLTLRRGFVRNAGFALVTLCVVGVGLEAGFVKRAADEELGRRKPAEDVPSRGSRNRRRVDEGSLPESVPSPSPSPVTTMPDEDPSEVAALRAKAHALLDPLGPLPGASPDGDLKERARKLSDELDNFDKHWTGNASANLELEMAQLALLNELYPTADRLADAATKLLPEKPKRGSAKARRLAIAYGTLGLAQLGEDDPKAALGAFSQAAEIDPTLPEPHFYLGKLAKDPERRKAELKAFVDLAGQKPAPSQAELLPEAKDLLGN